MTDTSPGTSPDPSWQPRSAPAAGRAADTAARVWGLIVLAVGIWFLLDVTFAMDMPRIPWNDLWPLAIIFVGLTILFRGMRRSA